jgi:hypothetical protein
VGASRAAGEDIVDVRFVPENFLAAFAHGRKIFPQLFETTAS